MKILVVEDNSQLAQSLALFFRDLGHEAETIGYGGKCVETLPSDFKPDHILLDATLPEYFIAKVLKAFRGAVAVGITADPEGHSNLPSDIPILEKPVEPSVVLATLEHPELAPASSLVRPKPPSDTKPSNHPTRKGSNA
jgi:CheY-like chemotaxis protein